MTELKDLLLHGALRGAGYGEIAVYAALDEYGPMKVAEIATHVPRTKKHLRTAVSHLVDKNLVTSTYGTDARAPIYSIADDDRGDRAAGPRHEGSGTYR